MPVLDNELGSRVDDVDLNNRTRPREIERGTVGYFFRFR